MGGREGRRGRGARTASRKEVEKSRRRRARAVSEIDSSSAKGLESGTCVAPCPAHRRTRERAHARTPTGRCERAGRVGGI